MTARVSGGSEASSSALDSLHRLRTPSAAALHDRRLSEVPTVASEVIVSAGSYPSEITWSLACEGLTTTITGGAPYSATHTVQQ